MKKIMIGILLLFCTIVFSQKDVKMTPIYAGNVYCPFYNDTILGAKSDTSVWYYINMANLTGYMTITYSIKGIKGDVICNIYKVFTNDTTMDANYTILADSINGVGVGANFTVDTTIQSPPKATAFMRFIVKNLSSYNQDKFRIRMKINLR